MFNRIIGVFKFDAHTFEDIEHDPGATTQAAIVVAVVALMAAIGGGMGAGFGSGSFFGGFISALIMTFVGWIVWAAVTYFVGTTFFGGKADMGEMLRVIGFAYAPQVLAIIPCVGQIVGAIWSLIVGFIAVRQGLDLDNTKAFFTIVIGFVIVIILWVIMGVVMGGAGAVLGSMG